MSKCPNISSPDWKNLVQRVGEDKAWFLWFENNSNYPSEQAIRNVSEIANDTIYFQKESESEPITLEEFEQQRQQISSDFNADVVFDESLEEVASVEKVGDRNKITVNPNIIFADTLTHE